MSAPAITVRLAAYRGHSVPDDTGASLATVCRVIAEAASLGHFTGVDWRRGGSSIMVRLYWTDRAERSLPCPRILQCRRTVLPRRRALSLVGHCRWWGISMADASPLMAACPGWNGLRRRWGSAGRSRRAWVAGSQRVNGAQRRSDPLPRWLRLDTPTGRLEAALVCLLPGMV
jgi:hypothetical protein